MSIFTAASLHFRRDSFLHAFSCAEPFSSSFQIARQIRLFAAQFSARPIVFAIVTIASMPLILYFLHITDSRRIYFAFAALLSAEFRQIADILERHVIFQSHEYSDAAATTPDISASRSRRHDFSFFCLHARLPLRSHRDTPSLPFASRFFLPSDASATRYFRQIISFLRQAPAEPAAIFRRRLFARAAPPIFIICFEALLQILAFQLSARFSSRHFRLQLPPAIVFQSFNCFFA